MRTIEQMAVLSGDHSGSVFFLTNEDDILPNNKKRFYCFGHDAAMVKHVTGREFHYETLNGAAGVAVCQIIGVATMKDVLYEMACSGWIVTISPVV